MSIMQNIELVISISGIIGMCIGLWISRESVHERDQRIEELENKIKELEDNNRL